MNKRIKKMVNRWLNRGKARRYLIHKQNNKYALCKVLNKYDTENDAIHDMTELVTNKVTEMEVIDKRVD